MDSTDEIIKLLQETWAKKTLGDLKIEALKEKTGIAYDALRVGGKRVIMVVCIAKAEEVKRISSLFNIKGDGDYSTWSDTPLLEVAVLCMKNSRPLVDCDLNEDGSISSICLICSDPVSMEKIETLFKMPI